jgi:hypothetical protein
MHARGYPTFIDDQVTMIAMRISRDPDAMIASIASALGFLYLCPFATAL